VEVPYFLVWITSAHRKQVKNMDKWCHCDVITPRQILLYSVSKPNWMMIAIQDLFLISVIIYLLPILCPPGLKIKGEQM